MYKLSGLKFDFYYVTPFVIGIYTQILESFVDCSFDFLNRKKHSRTSQNADRTILIVFLMYIRGNNKYKRTSGKFLYMY